MHRIKAFQIQMIVFINRIQDFHIKYMFSLFGKKAKRYDAEGNEIKEVKN